ncbi:MAG: response regulator [Euryarchaeota archaeon]|nr:response regulator [Euryarchaeota archaeon]
MTQGADARTIAVLIVEDRPVARKVLETELGEADDLRVAGFAKNGREAIERVKELSPDVVIMDIVMPEMDGLTALAEIRKFSDVPVIMLSGSHENAETLQHLAKKRGADAFFLKPSGPVSVDLYRIKDELVATIRDVVARERAA